MIGEDVGMRLKVMEFWKCSETGLAADTASDEAWETLKIVVVESLPHIGKTEIQLAKILNLKYREPWVLYFFAYYLSIFYKKLVFHECQRCRYFNLNIFTVSLDSQYTD